VLDDVTDRESCFAALFEHFARPEAWRLEGHAAEVIRVLAGQSHVLGLASNYDSRLRTVVAGLPALQRLRHLVISSEIGWRKPAREFFSALQKTVGLPPEQVLYVGDDPVNDYDAAAAAGFRAVLFDPENAALSGGVHGITTLADLVAV
jgi:putative hydrolase of the HAD superfamily